MKQNRPVVSMVPFYLRLKRPVNGQWRAKNASWSVTFLPHRSFWPATFSCLPMWLLTSWIKTWNYDVSKQFLTVCLAVSVSVSVTGQKRILTELKSSWPDIPISCYFEPWRVYSSSDLMLNRTPNKLGMVRSRLATSRPWGREGAREGARDPSDEVASEARHRRVWKGLWKV
jgi:hypothetical protein